MPTRKAPKTTKRRADVTRSRRFVAIVRLLRVPPLGYRSDGYH